MLCLLLVAGPLHALDPAHHVSEYTVTAWNMEDGLAHNLVHALAQDADGYLWIGSWEGAARFNGRTFASFGKHAAPGISLAGARAILRDRDGALLFGTAQNGVVRLLDGVWSTLEPTVVQRLRALELLRTTDGDLWIGTDTGLWRLSGETSLQDVGSTVGLAAGSVFALLDLGPDGLLIGSEHGAFLLRENRLEAWGLARGIPPGQVRGLLLRRDGSFVIAASAGAFLAWPDGRLDQLFASEVEAVLEDRDGALWLSVTSGGLVRYFHGRLDTIDETLGLRGRGSPAMMEDRDGLIWVGTTNGLFRIADAPAFGLGTVRGLGDNYPRTILRHPSGTLYVGHARGLDRWTGDGFRPVPLDVQETSVLALAPALDGGLWIGTYDRGVLYLPADGRTETIRRIDGLPMRHVRALRETSDGSLWIGTTAGLVRRWPDGRIEPIEDAPGHLSAFIRGIAPARDGGLWIGFDNGLMRWHPDGRSKRWLASAGFPGVGSFDVLETARGTAFIGSDRGLLRLRNEQFTVLDSAAGIPNDTIFRLLQDGLGALWLCSNRGAFRIDRAQFEELDAGLRDRVSVDTVDRLSGMPSSQCNGGSGPAGDLDGNGAIWFPTALGVAVIDPEAVAARSRVRVPVHIEGVQVDGVAQSPGAKQTLASTVRRVVIQYIGLHLRAPQGVRYRYRMVGFDHDWVDVGTGTEAVYTNLPVGPLRFEVQATMAPPDWQGLEAIPTATLDLEQLPPLWLRPWFLALALLALVALLLGVTAWRSASFRAQQARLRRIIDARTHELSSKNQALQEADRERESLLRQLSYQASHDALTGLANRRAGEARLVTAIEAAERSGTPLCVALMDVDHFKQINDSHGHAAGDAVLRHLSALLSGSGFVRPEDVARHGGEEFLLILPRLDLAAAIERLRALGSVVATSSVALGDGARLSCSVSVGVAQWQPGLLPSRLVALADQRLYLAKQQGRDRVVAVG